MMTTESLLADWQELLRKDGPRHQRVREHPLELFVGSSAVGQPVLFLVSASRPELQLISKAIRVERRWRERDSRWVLLLTLEDALLLRPFMTFCLELIMQSGCQTSPPAAWATFFRTLTQWRSLLASRTPGRLSQNELRGLFAELWFLLHHSGEPIAEAISCWSGPFGAAQDFHLPTKTVEVKAVQPGARTVAISSADQLAPPGSADLQLVLIELRDESVETHGNSTLPGLLTLVRERCSQAPNGLEALEDRLAALNFDESDAEYLERHFAVTGLRRYTVNGAFPRILPTELPTGVDSIKYDIRLSELEPYLLGTDELGSEHGR